MQDKPCKYTYADEQLGYSSSYEDEDGIFYPKNPLLGGTYARGRLFFSQKQSCCIGQKRYTVVLNPITNDPNDYSEVHVKYAFFKAYYPREKIQLLESVQNERKTYRLILPFIDGYMLSEMKPSLINPQVQVEVFLSIVRALQDCHDIGFVFIDISEDNLRHKDGKSYLIDGGLSAKINTPLRKEVFQARTPQELEANRNKYIGRIPPECWSQIPVPVLATPSMDVYGFGNLLLLELQKSYNCLSKSHVTILLRQLAYSAHKANPAQRPSFDEIEEQLIKLMPPASQIQERSNAPNRQLARAAVRARTEGSGGNAAQASNETAAAASPAGG